MNRFRFAALHFRLFRLRPLWWGLWIMAWLFQLFSTIGYWVDQPLPAIDRVVLGIVLLGVFHAGNVYSPRNNTRLRILPLPRSTCFLVDAIFPLILFLILPLLREIPALILSGFPFSLLFWAWADILILHTVLFSAVWLLGCQLPPLNTPPLFAGMLAGVIFWHGSLSRILERLTTVRSVPELFERSIPNDQRYFTLLGAALLVCSLAGAALRVQKTGLRIFWAQTAVIPPTLMFLMCGPALVNRMLAWLDLQRPLPEASALGWEVHPLPQLSRKQDTFRQGPQVPSSLFQHYTFPFFAEHTQSQSETAFFPERSRIRASGTETWHPLTLNPSHPGSGVEGRTLAAWLRATELPVPVRLFWVNLPEFSFDFDPATTLPDFSGGAVEIELMMRVDPYAWQEISLAAPMDTPIKFRDGIHAFTLRNTSMRWLFEREPIRLFFSAELRNRHLNLQWRRLFHGKKSPSFLASVFTHTGQEAPQTFVSMRSLGGNPPPGVAFPASTERIHSTFHPDAEWIASYGPRSGHPQDSMRMHLILIAPTGQSARVTVQDYQRFFALSPTGFDPVRTGGQSVTSLPPGPWLVDLLHRLATESAGRLQEPFMLPDFFQALSLLPAESYREALFEAAKLHPHLTALIVANGWEEQAMEVWQDLARQQVPLPAAARKTFLRSGDPVLFEAWQAQERWAPIREDLR